MQGFINLIRSRSNEHAVAFSRVHDLPGTMMSILRQELDSLIRVLFLLSMPDLDEKKRLMSKTLAGERWTVKTPNGKFSFVTDAMMVEVSEKFVGWARSVYEFGCAFVHLSNFHGYHSSNPLSTVSDEEKTDILSHMRHYHGGPANDNPTFDEFAQYFPQVFEKVRGNLECYLEDLATEVGPEHVL